MFDAYARELLEMLPALPGLHRAACRRALSEAYLTILRTKFGLVESAVNNADLLITRSLLRRMSDALESAAVFDRLHNVVREARVEEACAFVAAESLALLTQILPEVDHDDESVAERNESDEDGLDGMQQIETSIAVEAALLYLIGGYDVNAVALVKHLPSSGQRTVITLRDARLHNAEVLRERLKDFCSGRVISNTSLQPTLLEGSTSPLYANLCEEVRTWIYYHLAVAVSDFLAWLEGGEDDRREQASAAVDQVRRATAPKGGLATIEFADMHHLAALLAAAFDRTATRSVAHVLPPPPTEDPSFLSQFRAYVIRRVQGTREQSGRPFLWPSALEFIKKCLPGPSRDAVVAMPTGSGKSFVAELAIVHALSHGSVLYLAPTNALVHQVRRDLEHALKPLENIKVLAFIGSGEYTGLDEEGLATAQGRFIAVMTPEKCAVALRLDPQVIATCELCVFDECHLINDEQRGITADVLLAQLFHLAPTMRFLLMSAMVANPQQLADWLHSARQQDARASVTKWRPTRTLRGLLAVDGDGLDESFITAKQALETAVKKSEGTKRPRKKMSFDAPLSLIAGLSGPWTLDANDYRVTRLGITVAAAATVKPGRIGAVIPSWKNPATRILAEKLASMEIPTIGFILTSRHHPFTLARDVTTEIPGRVPEGTTFPTLVEAWLAIGDSELGVETELRSLLHRGIAVHTSAMLQVEQAAAERMFQHGLARLMFATGTLAQGLNLPAIAVVVSGTKMGDPRDADKIPGLGSRVDAAILNAFGRAGRPTFSNQGVAILVSDKPSVWKSQDTISSQTLAASEVLTRPDAGIKIGSPVTRFFDRMLADASPILGATSEDLTLTAQLSEQPLDGDHAGEVLRRTFGGYLRRDLFSPQASLLIRDRLAEIKTLFLQQPGMPPWMNTAATRAGVDIFRAAQMWTAAQQGRNVVRDVAEGLNVTDWLKVLFEALSSLPPKYAAQYFADVTQKTPTVLTRLRDAAQPYIASESLPSAAPPEWAQHWNALHALTLAYIQGVTYAALARSYYGADKIAQPVPSDRTMSSRPYNNPIPGIFGFIRDVIEPLARDAGCLVALLEQAWKAEGAAPPPESLQALPLCVRFGCNSIETLAWYRFGFRQRISAHALARAFPLVGTFQSDTQRAAEVRSLRKQWLDGRISPVVSDSILTHVATVLREAGN
jgi:hypothetical protein